jgi:D-aspartate ligase
VSPRGRRPPAVVVDVGWVPGISTIHALARGGYAVHAVDHRPGALGFRSRHATPHVSPSRLEDEDGFVAFLRDLGDRLGEPAPIFALDDDDLNAIARRRDELGERFRCPFPAWPELARVQDKRHQLAVARDIGVPVPRSAAEPTDALGWPVLVKPAETGAFRRQFGVKAFPCENVDELESAWQRAEGFGAAVYEWIPGADDELYTLGSHLAADGTALGLFCGRKLAQDPPGIGTARAAEAVWVDEVVEHGLRLLRGLGFHGVSQVELKRDPRDGSFKLMEVNPRLWQWHGLAAACGVNLPVIAARDLAGDPPPPVRMRPGRRRWSITLKRGRRPLVLRPPYVDPLLTLRDPRLALAHLRYQVGR